MSGRKIAIRKHSFNKDTVFLTQEIRDLLVSVSWPIMDHQLFRKHLEFVTLDVFTSEPFKGNPLAVVKVPRDFTLNHDRKQLIAREFNFSETVFLHGPEDGSSTWKIGIFTTTAELPFAGHPTIGTICHIGSSMESPTQELTLLTKAGPISAHYDSAKKVAEAEIPHDVKVHTTVVDWGQVVGSQRSLPDVSDSEGRNIFEQWIYSGPGQPRATFPVVSIVKGMTFILVDFPSHYFLETIEPSHEAISSGGLKFELDPIWSPSFITPYYYVAGSCGADGIKRIEARMIDSEMGEDPATGSAACTLSAYLALQDGKPGMTYSYEIEQGTYMGRDSTIDVKVTLDGSGIKVKQVLLGGAAVLITKGTIIV